MKKEQTNFFANRPVYSLLTVLFVLSILATQAFAVIVRISPGKTTVNARDEELLV
jgi:hypothetical protein